jgi:8-oxo-dGTP pyrophosphatase MutT (NUDIX family)
MSRIIRIAAALLIDGDRTLLVRKRGTTAFMQPGGKIELGETAEAALRRELHEELELTIAPSAARYLGQFSAIAANESDAIVVAELFELRATGPVHPAAEIEEIRWVDATTTDIELAPLTRDHVLPAWRLYRPTTSRSEPS